MWGRLGTGWGVGEEVRGKQVCRVGVCVCGGSVGEGGLVVRRRAGVSNTAALCWRGPAFNHAARAKPRPQPPLPPPKGAGALVPVMGSK